jgi:AmmeMemoRadiSam system protein B
MPVTSEERVRPPAVAGLFYPKDPARLRSEIAELMAHLPAGPVVPKALIAPHAGYVYSGRVAAHAFARLSGGAQAITRVVVVGPAHYVPFRGIAAPLARVFETPLGRVAVDARALETLADLDFVSAADGPHAPEHALEVELPFLQWLKIPFQLVPLVIGDAEPEEVAQVLSRVWGGPETLLVISSDLSHYQRYEEAVRRDAATAALIERSDWRQLSPQRACGYLAIAGLLIEGSRRGLAARRLALCNSGDTAGDRARVVGYGTWAFEGGS